MAQNDQWADFRTGTSAAPANPVRTGPVFVPAPGATEEQARRGREEVRANTGLGISQASEARAASGATFDKSRDLRQEFRKSQAVADYQTVVRQFATALKTDATPTGDQALITAYAKMLDPGSVVREQEFNTVAAGDSAIGMLTAKLNKELGVDGAGLLRPEVRQNVRTEMLNLTAKYRQAYEQTRDDYSKLAADNGLPPDQIVGTHLGQTYRAEIEAGWKKLFPDGIPGQSGATALQVAQGGDFSTDQDIEIAGKLQEAWNGGATADQINNLSQQLTGKPLSPADLETLRKSQGGSINFAPSKSGKRDGGGDMGLSAAFGAGMVRGYTANQAEEMVGAVDPVSAAKLQGAADTAQEQHPVAAFGGELVGGVLSPLAKIGKGISNPITREAVQGAAYGGAYGAGEAPAGADMRQRIEQGAIGAVTGGLAGGLAGKYLGPKAAQAADEVPPPSGGIAPDAPAPAPVPPTPDIPAPTEPLTEPLRAAVPEDQVVQLAELVRKAQSFSLSRNAARRDIAQLAKANPEAKAAADRLGIELPADILGDSQQLKALSGLSRSQVGSVAQAEWNRGVIEAAQKADDALAELGATRDLAETSEAVFQRMNSAMEGLRNQGASLRDEVNAAISVTDRLEASNLQSVLGQRIEELGGLKDAKQAFTTAEKKLLAMLGEGETAKMPTYGRLNQMRDEIGRAMEKGEGPWADVSQANLKQYYAALAEDQLGYIERIGGAELADKMRASNDLFSRMFDARKDMQALYGQKLEKTLTPILTRSIEQGSKGDAQALRTLMDKVPEDMRGSLLATGLLAKATGTGYQGGFNFANFAKYYRGLRSNGPIYAEFAKALGPSGERILSDLYSVSRRVAEGSANISKTGQSNQALLALTAERLLGRMFKSGAARMAVSGAASAGGGPVGAMMATATTELLERGGKGGADRLHKLMTSPQFRAFIERGSDADLNRLAGSRPFIEWSRGIVPNSFKDRQAWIRSAIAPVAADQTAAPTIDLGAQ